MNIKIGRLRITTDRVLTEAAVVDMVEQARKGYMNYAAKRHDRTVQDLGGRIGDLVRQVDALESELAFQISANSRLETYSAAQAGGLPLARFPL